ncbi:antibiotic biosynthesis monooxygenase family protein [Thermodesulfobacteriota bacterium]
MPVNEQMERKQMMAVKVMINRKVSKEKARRMIPLFREMRSFAIHRKGYVSGETLRDLNDPDNFLVISTWLSSKDWETWLVNKKRQKIRRKMDELLGGKTEYSVFHHGFTE